MSKAIRNNQKVILLIPPPLHKTKKAPRSLFFEGGRKSTRQNEATRALFQTLGLQPPSRRLLKWDD